MRGLFPRIETPHPPSLCEGTFSHKGRREGRNPTPLHLTLTPSPGDASYLRDDIDHGLVVVSLAQPRLGLLWFVPLGMFLTPGSGQPTPFQTSWTLFVALVTVGFAMRASKARFRAVNVDPGFRALARPA
jgi:hypothetical protein